MSNKYLHAKWTMEKLVAEMNRISADPASKNPNKDSINIYTPAARKKMDDISWAIYHHLKASKVQA